MGSGSSKRHGSVKSNQSSRQDSQKSNRKSSTGDNSADDMEPAPRKFLQKQSADARKREQHQMYLAQESPEPTFDLSRCELSEIPHGVFSLCKVLQKEALLCHNNWISSLKGGGNIRDLAGIRVLDLHHNYISSIPEEIGDLQCLQVLNLGNNKLKSLPSSIGTISTLQTLNLKGNKLSSLPESVCDMKSLRNLDVSDNPLTQLPKRLCHVRTLEQLTVNAANMDYPPSEICEEGTEAVMKFLCDECGIEYLPPSQFLLGVLDPPKPADVVFSTDKLRAEVTAINETVMQYEKIKEQRRLEHVALERQLSQEQRDQAELVAQANKQKERILQLVAEENALMHNEIMSSQQKRELERQRLVETLNEVEMNATNLVEQLLQMNEKARKTEELLEAMEQERIQAEELYRVRQEELDNVRKKDVLAAMQNILKESEEFDLMMKRHFSNRDEAAKRSLKGRNETDGKLTDVLMSRESQKNSLIEQLMMEEELQKEAFEALQLQQDAKHQRLNSQIELIQEELAALSMVEVEQREMRMDTQRNILEEKRQALTKMMVQLMDERDAREQELKSRMREMEENRENDQEDYWLVQYQRLMDRKPEGLKSKEHNLDYEVVSILEKAAATEYMPQFARRKINIDDLCDMTIDDFKLMGVRDGVRDRILAEVEDYKRRLDFKAKKKAEDLEKLFEPDTKHKMERPQPAEEEVHPNPTAPPPEVVSRFASECVVCQDAECNIIFLNCGHVCCCAKCASPLTQCPLCRGEIVQRVRLSRDR